MATGADEVCDILGIDAADSCLADQRDEMELTKNESCGYIASFEHGQFALDRRSMVQTSYVAAEDSRCVMLNCGEVEDEKTDFNVVPSFARERLLDFKSTSSKQGLEDSSRPCQVFVHMPPSSCTDEVQPFALENFFNYDCVQLTPKFVSADR